MYVSNCFYSRGFAVNEIHPKIYSYYGKKTSEKCIQMKSLVQQNLNNFHKIWNSSTIYFIVV